MAVQNGDTVEVDYTGRLENGQVFDTSEGKAPIAFTVGAHQVVPGFENGVVGMEAGESKTLTIPPEQAYGEHNPELVRVIPHDQMGEGTPEQGMMLGFQDQQGNQFQGLITQVGDDGVHVDFNHFLAGQTLIFDIKVINVNADDSEE